MVYTADLKSVLLTELPVRVRPRAPSNLRKSVLSGLSLQSAVVVRFSLKPFVFVLILCAAIARDAIVFRLG